MKQLYSLAAAALLASTATALADAYVTQDGLMYVQVTTFDPADMKFREE